MKRRARRRADGNRLAGWRSFSLLFLPLYATVLNVRDTQWHFLTFLSFSPPPQSVRATVREEEEGKRGRELRRRPEGFLKWSPGRRPRKKKKKKK
jgi:hypothetical protein